MDILTRHCMGDQAVRFQVLSDQAANFTTGCVLLACALAFRCRAKGTTSQATSFRMEQPLLPMHRWCCAARGGDCQGPWPLLQLGTRHAPVGHALSHYSSLHSPCAGG